MTIAAAVFASVTDHPSDYAVFVVLGMAVAVFGVLTGVGVWFLTAEAEPARPRRPRRPNMDPGPN